MGFALAAEAAARGAEVVLIAGPVKLDTPHSAIRRIDVTSADEMNRAVQNEFPHSDITIMAAAVADFTPVTIAPEKIKKQGKEVPEIRLKPTADILSGLGSSKRPNQILGGFALETEQEESNAIKKLKNKNLDFIVLNSLKDEGAGFGYETNKITLYFSNGKKRTFGLKMKSAVASDILDSVEDLIKK